VFFWLFAFSFERKVCTNPSYELQISISGNIEPNEAKSVIQHVEDVLFNSPTSVCKSLSPSQHLAKRIVKLEKGLRYYYPAMCSNNQDENSALLHYIQARL
jgi:insulysin